ncbi:MAG: alpha/beta hydrolase family protein [Gemmatimonadota bacterium]
MNHRLFRDLRHVSVPVFLAAAVTGAYAQAPQGSATAATPALKVLDAGDLAFWKTIRTPTLSWDGKWFGYVVAPSEGDGEFVIRPTAADGAEKRFPIGEPGGGGGGPFGGPAAGGPIAVSGDSKWAGFTVYPKSADAKRLTKERKPLQNNVSIINLATGVRTDVEKIRRFEFAGEKPGWVVLHRYAAEGASTSDLLLLDLRTGVITTIGSVGEYALEESGTWLAYTTEARDMVGNGLQLRNLVTDVVRGLDSEKELYRRLTWADSGLALTVLRGRVDSAASDTSYTVIGITGIATGTPMKVSFAHGDAPNFPGGMRVSPDRAARWASDFSALFFGIADRKTAPDPKNPRPDVRPVAGTPGAMQRPAGAGMPDDELPTLVIWHGKGDARLQSQQQVQENQDKQHNWLSTWRVAEKRFIRIAVDTTRDVQLAPRERFAIASDRRNYERRDNIDGGQRRDIYVVDLRTGDRKLARRKQQFLFVPSPDGTRALYYDDGHFHVHDFAAGASSNISASAPVSFVNVEDDHNIDRPPVNPLGWASDNAHVLLFDGWDVWKAPVRGNGSTMINLTGNGRKDRIRYTRRVSWNPRERGIDLTQPLWLQTYGERTKKEGIARVMPNRPGAEPLVWDDARFFFTRARNADVWTWTRQTVSEFPDYWVGASGVASGRRLTDANPQQKDYAWSSGSRLINYVSDKGDSLQGAMHLPASFDPSKKYPMVVYIYEKLSQGLHAYAVPNETRAFNPSVYTSRGYVVFQPDIVYRINDPGMSSVWCVVPAVKEAIATGFIDADKVGLHGHSWGGYQSSFLATQTGKLFSGIVTGAPLTDMISMYNSVYWNTGTADMAIFESSQGRFKGSYLDHMDAYVRNSPAFFAHKVETPVMILHNEKDGAVDFNQGITWFNTLREQEKNVIMLQYVGENHGLQLPKNQKDYTIRMMEYFDTFLLGKPAPDWILNGVPRLRMEEHLKSRQKKEVKVAS